MNMRKNRFGWATALAVAASAVTLIAACGGSDEAEAGQFGKAEVVHSWKRMDWVWRSGAEQAAYTADGVYKAATLAGVDVDRKGNVYVTTPRWLDSRIPSTLSQVVTVNGKSVLLPFPNWDSNAVGDAANKLQNVLGVEVDSKNRMWLVDMGWVAGVDVTPDGAQKIVVLDLNTGVELKRYAIPDSVANRNTQFLNDLVIDEKRELAFITDSGNRSGSPTASGIVIYDFKTNTARRVLNNHPSVQDDPSRELSVMGDWRSASTASGCRLMAARCTGMSPPAMLSIPPRCPCCWIRPRLPRKSTRRSRGPCASVVAATECRLTPWGASI
jgi:hypothetical protein